MSFTWVIGDIALLRDEVEHSSAPGASVDEDEASPSSSFESAESSESSSLLGSDADESDGFAPTSSEHDADGITRSVSAGAGRSEVWTTEPTFGNGQWKLELVRRQTVAPEQPRQRQQQRQRQRQRQRRRHDVAASAIPVSVPVPGLTSASAFRATSERAHRAPRARKRKTVTTLSVYLTNCAMEKPLPALKRKPATPVFNRPTGSVHAAIMVGVRPLSALPLPQDSGIGVLDPAPYLHQSFHSFVFSHEAEYFACHDLPPLSKLMEHPDVQRQDAVALTINIVTGAGADVMSGTPSVRSAGDMNISSSEGGLVGGPGTVLFPQPNTRYVAPSILDALGSLLDCPRSGDVCIRTRERGVAFLPAGWSARQSARLQSEVQRQRGKSPIERPYSSDEPEADPGSGSQRRATAEAESEPDYNAELAEEWLACVRLPSVPERLVQPFPLGSAMPTPAPGVAGESVLVVRDRVIWAHSAVLKARSGYFATMLESKFAEGGGDEGRSVHELRMADADYATVYWLLRYLYVEHVDFAEADEAKEACGNVDDTPALGPALCPGLVAPGQDGFLVDWTPVEALEWCNKVYDAILYDGWNHTLSPAPTQASELGADAPPVEDRIWCEGSEADEEGCGAARIGADRAADPHAHPCQWPARLPPASALTMYRLAHRYGEARLLAAAEQHVLAHLASSTAFRVFLATRFFASLHAGVTRFVHNNWTAVAESPEFERCCDEVSQGDVRSILFCSVLLLISASMTRLNSVMGCCWRS